jgi:hypothetical protein
MSHPAIRLLLCISLAAGTTGGAYGDYSGIYDPGADADASRDFDTSFGRDPNNHYEPGHDHDRRQDDSYGVDRDDILEDDNRRNRCDDNRGNRHDTHGNRSSMDAFDMVRHVDNHFEGSQFRASTFMDTDFRKKSYRDSFRTKPGSEMRMDARMRADDTIKRLSSDDDRIYAADGDEDSPADGMHDRGYGRTWRELTEPIPDMLTDWVPDKVKRLHNGGFSISPENGRPVPYKLNGHLDIERNLPWKSKN